MSDVLRPLDQLLATLAQAGPSLSPAAATAENPPPSAPPKSSAGTASPETAPQSAEPPIAPRLGGLGWVLSVRDLASRRQLLWRHVPSPSAEIVVAALEELFREHGPPLVLKSDNGSAYIAAATLDCLARHAVIPLFSPPRRPQYNGGCERGGGILKGYTKQVAASAGRPGVCLPADLEQARQLANRLTRPWGRHGPSPDDAWQARHPLSPPARETFQAELARARATASVLLEYACDQSLTRVQTARRDRRAAQAALETLGYLCILKRGDPSLNQPPTSVPHPPRTSAPLRSIEKSASVPASLAEKPCTLTAGAASSTVSESIESTERTLPAHRESAIIRVLRRSITPLLRILKAAKIP